LTLLNLIERAPFKCHVKYDPNMTDSFCSSSRMKTFTIFTHIGTEV